MTDPPTGLRIGELSRRVGVAPETLRAWERRYRLLHPSRTEGGYRVYGREDQRRAERMRHLIAEGWAAGEAAAATVAGTAPAPAPPPAPAAGVPGAETPDLLGPLLRFDAAAGHAAFDRVLAARTLDAALRDVVLPVLHEVGERWARGHVTIAQEHFATELVTGRLRSLARDWDSGVGPRAVLACPEGERHDVGLLCCGLALQRRGWRVIYLGADTPGHALAGAVDALDPALVVVGLVREEPLRAALPGLAELARRVPVAVGGAGARADRVTGAGLRYLGADPVTAAADLSADLQAS